MLMNAYNLAQGHNTAISQENHDPPMPLRGKYTFEAHFTKSCVTEKVYVMAI